MQDLVVPCPNLAIHKMKIEDFLTEYWRGCDTSLLILIAVHSHAPLECYVSQFDAECLITIPCCIPQETTHMQQTHTFEDYGILSPHRKIVIWQRAKTQATATTIS